MSTPIPTKKQLEEMQRAEYLCVLPDPPWVNFGKALWRYGAGGDETISVDVKAVAERIRAALTDEVLDKILAIATLDMYDSTQRALVREGIIAAVMK